MKKGDIDAISNLDPVITKLEQDGDIKVVADSRTEAGTRPIWAAQPRGRPVSSATAERIRTRSRLSSTPFTGLKWLEKASREEVAATVPQEYYLGDKALYVAAAKANKEAYSVTGDISEGGIELAADMLLAFDDELKGSKIDLAKTSTVASSARPPAGRCKRVTVKACCGSGGFQIHPTSSHRIIPLICVGCRQQQDR